MSILTVREVGVTNDVMSVLTADEVGVTDSARSTGLVWTGTASSC